MPDKVVMRALLEIQQSVSDVHKQLAKMTERMEGFERRLMVVEESNFTPPESPELGPVSELEDREIASAPAGSLPNILDKISPAPGKMEQRQPDNKPKLSAVDQITKAEILLNSAVALHERLEGIVGRLERLEVNQQKAKEEPVSPSTLKKPMQSENSSLWPELKLPLVNSNFSTQDDRNPPKERFTSVNAQSRDLDSRIKRIQADCVALLDERKVTDKRAPRTDSTAARGLDGKEPLRSPTDDRARTFSNYTAAAPKLNADDVERLAPFKTPARRPTTNGMKPVVQNPLSHLPDVVFGHPSLPTPSKLLSTPTKETSPWMKYSAPQGSSTSPFASLATAPNKSFFRGPEPLG